MGYYNPFKSNPFRAPKNNSLYVPFQHRTPNLGTKNLGLKWEKIRSWKLVIHK